MDRVSKVQNPVEQMMITASNTGSIAFTCNSLQTIVPHNICTKQTIKLAQTIALVRTSIFSDQIWRGSSSFVAECVARRNLCARRKDTAVRTAAPPKNPNTAIASGQSVLLSARKTLIAGASPATVIKHHGKKSNLTSLAARWFMSGKYARVEPGAISA
jgi:hypothetical protein